MALTAKKVYAILSGKIAEVSGDVSSLGTALQYKGSVATADALPTTAQVGDTYNIEAKSDYGEAGMNVAWNGTEWDALGAAIDVSLLLSKDEAVEIYLQKTDISDWAKADTKPTYTASEVGALPNTIDTELSNTSTNPVQNKAVKAAVDLKMDKAITDSVTGLKYEIGLEEGIMIFTEVE